MTAKTNYEHVKSHREKRLAAGDKQLNTWMVPPAAEALQALIDGTGLTREEIVCKALLEYHERHGRK